MSTKFLFVIIVLLYSLQFSLEYSPKEIYKDLDDKEKKYFLQFLLAKGYEDCMSESGYNSIQFHFPSDLRIPEYLLHKFEVYDITPDSFAKEFYKNFMTTFNLTTAQALGWVMGEIICLPSGECIDTGDAGSVCCT